MNLLGALAWRLEHRRYGYMKGPGDFGRSTCCGRDDGSLSNILVAVIMLGFTGGSLSHCAIYFATPEVGSHCLLLWAADSLGVASSSGTYRAQVDELLTIRLTDLFATFVNSGRGLRSYSFPAK